MNGLCDMKLADQEPTEAEATERFFDYEDARKMSKVLYSGAFATRWGLADLARLLRLLRWARGLIQDAEAELERRIDRVMTREKMGNQYDEEGLGRIERRRGAARVQVDRDRLTAAVAARALDQRTIDFTTGEALESESACMVRVLGRVFRFEPRWAEVEAMGLRRSEFSERGKGKLSVTVLTTDELPAQPTEGTTE